MTTQFSRTELIFGKDSMNVLRKSRVAVFGIGGVGGHTVEALARSGVGTLDIIDNDKFTLSNLNRQIFATHKTIDKYKVDAAEERILDICPDITVNKHKCFFMPDTSDQFNFTEYDYIVDAIDTVTGKLELISKAKAAGVRIISSMGAGNKIDPTAFRVSDIYKTRVCPLAKVMRYELRRRGIKDLKVVYSEEIPIKQSFENESDRVPGSNAFVPSVAGLIIAGEVIKDLIYFNGDRI